MDYAVIRTGGKQYRVSPGDTLAIEKLEADAGATIELAEVLLASSGGAVRVGTPLVDGAKETAKILSQGKDRKVLVFKKRRRKRYRRKKGHRQLITTIRVIEIQG